jgi:hypothetical protein
MNELALRQQSDELKALLDERKALQKTEMERLRAKGAETSFQTEMQKLEREHAESRHEAAMKLQHQRHINRMEKQKFLHEQAKELVLLRRNYPVELARQRAAKKAEEERQARQTKMVLDMLVVAHKAQRKMFLAAFGIQDDHESGQNDR